MRAAVLTLLLGGALAGCAAAPARVAGPADACHPAPGADREQYLVGYGSLMQDRSRKRTTPDAGPAHPVEVEGYRRGWFARGSPIGFSTTFLGVLPERGGRLNAVIYAVRPDEVAATDRREGAYCRERVAPKQVEPLERSLAIGPRAEIWIYVNKPQNVAPPDARYPIVESYVDIFVSGCLEQQERFGLAGFARRCLATTSGWSEHWVNDRLYPRRPFIYQPRAGQIDRLLDAALPQYFRRIRIEP